MSNLPPIPPMPFVPPPPLPTVDRVEKTITKFLNSTTPIPGACPPPPRPTAPIVEIPRPKINVRQKGQRGEREVIKLLQAVIDSATTKWRLEPIRLQRNTLQSDSGGCDLHGLNGFAIEVKFQEQEYNGAWWRQALEQAAQLSVRGKPAIPILFYRRSKCKWSVKVRLWVQTPSERDQVELDVTLDEPNFFEWFTSAIDEVLEQEAQNL